MKINKYNALRFWEECYGSKQYAEDFHGNLMCKDGYADYRKAREEMKELLTAKANIDRILELDKEQEEANERREKEAEQR